jgi:hypothetical protein
LPADFWADEKHVVKLADGTIDTEATARKQGAAYKALTAKLGSGDVRPAAVTDYKANVPAEFADKINADEMAATPGWKSLVASLHAAGASQAVVDAATAEFIKTGISIREAQPIIQAAECEATLKAIDGWKDPAQYKANMQHAAKAIRAYGGDQADALIDRYGSDPALVQLFARIGPELPEDRAPNADALGAAGGQLDALMANPAYTNANDPQHAVIKAQVDALTARVAGTRPIARGHTATFKAG